jgi:hypothetical protein
VNEQVQLVVMQPGLEQQQEMELEMTTAPSSTFQQLSLASRAHSTIPQVCTTFCACAFQL